MEQKIHYFESFCYPEIYKSCGIVWQPACRRWVSIQEDNMAGTTIRANVTCKLCNNIMNKYASQGMKDMGFQQAGDEGQDAQTDR